jgi:hypothetical protein
MREEAINAMRQLALSNSIVAERAREFLKSNLFSDD